MRGAPSEYSGTDISASREEKRIAYDSEEITTKAVDWRRDKMCVSNDAIHVLCKTRRS